MKIASKLFVPGCRPEFFGRALKGPAAAVCLDLEDSVPESGKSQARASVAAFLDSPELQNSRKTVIVRVNAPGTPHFEADVLALTRTGVDLLNVPKTESPAQMKAVAELMKQAEQVNGVAGTVGILANIETPKGLRRAAAIGQAHARVSGLQLGLGDLFEPLGIDRRDRENVHAAMYQLRMAAGEAEVFAYDGAFADLRDPDGFRAEAEMAQRLGYLGKSCIHPSQVELANAVFRPSDEQLSHARRVIEAWQRHQAEGRGAFAVDGKMIDRAFIGRAEALLASEAREPTPVQRPERVTVKPEPRGPLSGVRVLDLSAYIAGPYGCTVLGDMGAEVIKIEPPSGDNFRNYPSTMENASRAFLGINRGKRDLVLDLKRPEGLEILLKLAAKADVLVHNFRPGVAERLGIGFEQLEASHPHLVYCAVSGFGDGGPLKEHAGYDQVLQTMTGFCAAQGGTGRTPEITYGSPVDYYAGAMVTSGVTAALFDRHRTGKGQFVDVSLLRSALAMQSARMVWAEGEARDVDRDMRSGGVTGIHPTHNGYLYLSANTPHFWKALCQHVGLPELAANPRYDTVRKRAQHAPELVPQLQAALLGHSAEEWEAIFGQDVPCSAARTIGDMFDHPQVVAHALVQTFEHPTAGRYQGFAGAVGFKGALAVASLPAPTLGQHSAEVMEELGYSAWEISRLREQSVIT